MIEQLLFGLLLCSFMIVIVMLLILVLPIVLKMGIEEWIRLIEFIKKQSRK